MWNLLQWQPNINRVTPSNIDKKHIKMKETESVQSKETSINAYEKYASKKFWECDGDFGKAASNDTYFIIRTINFSKS